MMHSAAWLLFAALVLWARVGDAQQPIALPPDESVLGTVEVNGSAGNTMPLPKLAIVPLVTRNLSDSIAQLVVRGDLTLSGQFDVLPDSAAPAGPFLVDLPLDLPAWKRQGAEYVVRVFAESTTGGAEKLIAEVFLTSANSASVPLFRTSRAADNPENIRSTSHRLVDAILGAITGRPGGFSSQMVYVSRVSSSRQVFVLDADGFNLHSSSPPNATALSPAFGPQGTLFYALSTNLSPFRLVFTNQAIPWHLPVPGGVLGLAFSDDRSRLALTIMEGGKSKIYVAHKGSLSIAADADFANHPAFGPRGRLAWVAGHPLQRVYIDGKPISPSGFMASAPVFCDTPAGLLVFYTVRTTSGSDIVASNPNGAGIRRFTQRQGWNRDPACSPDGRLLSFFSSKGPQGAGLYIMPVARPWLAKKIADRIGDSLRWQATMSRSEP